MTDHIPADKLDQAREWAEWVIQADHQVIPPEMRGAAEVILALLPAPTPRTLADMTPAERQECVGMWCDNLVSAAKAPSPVVLACVQGELCWILHTTIHGEQSGFPLDAVAPRFDLPRAWSPSGEPVVEDAPEPELPQPEDAKPDPQHGEAWLVDYEGKRYEAVYWYSPLYAHWAFVRGREGLRTVESPEATPVSRLVPERGDVS